MVTEVDGECENYNTSYIVSRLVFQGALYYATQTASAYSTFRLGKLVADGAALVRTTSTYYANPSLKPPGLVLGLDSGSIVVYHGIEAPEARLGTLFDFGDHLGIIDRNGQELGSTL